MKTLKELENFDLISTELTDNDILKRLRRIYKNKEVVDFYFPLEEFVLKIKLAGGFNTVSYFYFNNSNNLIEVYINQKILNEFIYIGTIKITDVEKGKTKIIDINKDYLKYKDWLNELFNIFINTLLYLITIKDNANIKVKVEPQKRTKNNNNNKIKKTYRKGTSVTLIEGVKTIYKIEGNKENINKIKKKYERHAKSWSVMGHLRHYKNGKVIYIRPFVKGAGYKNKKEYKIK